MERLTATTIHPWLLRLTWVLLPLTAGPALASALDDRSSPVQLTVAVVLWAGWAAVLVATLVPHPVGLTALRVAAPAAVAAAVAAVATGEPSSGASVLGLAWTVLTAAVVLAPATASWAVNGPAYPNERRWPLRAPGALLVGPLQLAWAIAVGGPAAGLPLLASKAWVAGVVVLVVGLPAAFVLLRAMHGLSRRWVVLVPAGLVLHDPLTIADPVLFQRKVVERLRPAPADTDALDLTQRSPGLAVELDLLEKVPMVLVTPGKRGGEPGSSARLIFTPTRPGALLEDAARRRLPVG